MMVGVKCMVWKCLVLPGVAETDTFLEPTNALMVDDFPTLGYPTRPIYVSTDVQVLNIVVIIRWSSVLGVFFGLGLILQQLVRHECRKENIVYVALIEVLGPSCSLLSCQHISLVHQQQIGLSAVGVGVAQVRNVLLKVDGPEKQRVSGVDNADHQVASLHDSPELSPDLQVSLEGSQNQIVVFCQLRQISSPVQKCQILAAFNLEFQAALGPAWSSGDRQAVLEHAVLFSDFFDLLARQNAAAVDYRSVSDLDNLDAAVPVGGEIGVGQAGGRQELVERVLARHGAHFDPLGLLFVGGEAHLAVWQEADVVFKSSAVGDVPSQPDKPDLMTTEHMNTSMGAFPSGNLPVSLPVVLYKPKADFKSISPTALCESILLPKIKKGTLDNSSILNNDSNSARDSANLSGSAASTKNTIPLTSGK